MNSAHMAFWINSRKLLDLLITRNNIELEERLQSFTQMETQMYEPMNTNRLSMTITW